MIPKISRGQKIGGLLVYLLGEGEHNEHRHRHLVAGSPSVMQAEWLRDFDGPQDKRASRDVALAIAHELDLPRQLHGTQARMRAKVGAGVGGRGAGADVVEPAAKGEKGAMRNAPVWHCVLALNPGEELSDEKWGELANEFMSRMGFCGSADGTVAHARWAAVRHGRSGEHGEGQEHIHIAASLIREDGSKVSTYDYGPGRRKGDRLRAQEVCNELEHQFGLRVLRSREDGGGHSGNSRAEVERATRIGAPETERERLRRVVRAAATGSDTEADFVHALREAGVSLRPRYAEGGRDHVVGYSVRWRRDGVEVGPWVGGGRLDHDLTLSALREQQWADSPAARVEAVTAWRGRSQRSGARRAGADLEDPETWRAAAAEIGEWQRRLDSVPATDRAQWAWAAGQASGVFAAFSEALEGNEPGPFAAAARELARSAQVPYASQRYNPRAAGRGGLAESTRTGLGAAALLLFEEAARAGGSRLHGAGAEVSELAALIVAALLVLLLIAVAIALRIANAHRARWQVMRAVEIDQSLRHLDPVRRAWETNLADRRFAWDRDAAQVFTSATARRVAKVLGEDALSEAEQLLGAARIREITAAAEDLVPGVTSAPAWPALLSRLAELESGGRDAIEDLTTVVRVRELGSAEDMAAVLSWRIEHLLDITTPAPAAGEPAPAPPPTPTRPHRFAAQSRAQTPLTPPAITPLPRRLSRPFYTELPEEDRVMRRLAAVVTAGHTRLDTDLMMWEDDQLGGELLHRRAEVTALREEVDARRRGGGPLLAQAQADNKALTEQAAAITAAKQVLDEADRLEREQADRERDQERLEREQANTSRWSPRVRARLDAQIAAVREQIDQHAPAVAAARSAADAAVEDTGVPEEQWVQVLRSATEAQCQRRVREATAAAAAALDDDSRMLWNLERELEQVEAEHTSRGRMTSEQRAASVQKARQKQQEPPPRLDLGLFKSRPTGRTAPASDTGYNPYDERFDAAPETPKQQPRTPQQDEQLWPEHMRPHERGPEQTPDHGLGR
ncbi:relaxase/mobilization nuclease domain-containing protein [Nocardia brasiliensis]|uniref:relaxase/mobilization nuclease domain-containing protein n=1 Tax=Nocardia brasiliensis TaxID=37326 RepID=UPI0018946AC1|nr:hypothetical protein [Nocardia brasiliensis]MBF6548856.1 hypothetical protein [Nocardia brasiliensis]